MKQLYKHGGNAYLIIHKSQFFKFEDKNQNIDLEKVKVYRDWLKSDHVLRDQTHFLFCETIQDVEFEEIIDDSTIQTQ
jgi:hypothetical protein